MLTLWPLEKLLLDVLNCRLLVNMVWLVVAKFAGMRRHERCVLRAKRRKTIKKMEKDGNITFAGGDEELLLTYLGFQASNQRADNAENSARQEAEAWLYRATGNLDSAARRKWRCEYTHAPWLSKAARQVGDK